MSEASRWPAPAKLNLFLHVTGRRDDGYHTLQTVFQFLDLCDEIDIAVREDGIIRARHLLPGVASQDDLCVRAATALQRASGTPLGAELTLHKRIPIGGGLGGGSSDAATVLVALNRLWGLDWEPPRLAALALALGADVPVFVGGRAAWAEGVGERLRPLAPPEPWYLVLCPPCRVSTAAVFNDPALTRDTPPITISTFFQGRTRNDCEPVVRAAHPEVARALDWLGRQAPARMTGTGACVFAAFAGREEAETVLARAPEGMQGFVARGRNRSPLLDRLHWGVAKR